METAQYLLVAPLIGLRVKRCIVAVWKPPMVIHTLRCALIFKIMVLFGYVIYRFIQQFCVDTNLIGLVPKLHSNFLSVLLSVSVP